MTKKVIPIYRYEFQYRYFRYIGIPNIPMVEDKYILLNFFIVFSFINLSDERRNIEVVLQN